MYETSYEYSPTERIMKKQLTSALVFVLLIFIYISSANAQAVGCWNGTGTPPAYDPTQPLSSQPMWECIFNVMKFVSYTTISGKDTILIRGANLHVRYAGPSPDGTGNLIVGVNHTITGSTNGFVTGSDNTITGISPSVCGGQFNQALSWFSSISGGKSNVVEAGADHSRTYPTNMGSVI